MKRVNSVSVASFHAAQHRVSQLQSQQCLVAQAVVDTCVQVPGQDRVGQVGILAAVVERQRRIVC